MEGLSSFHNWRLLIFSITTNIFNILFELIGFTWILKKIKKYFRLTRMFNLSRQRIWNTRELINLMVRIIQSP